MCVFQMWFTRFMHNSSVGRSATSGRTAYAVWLTSRCLRLVVSLLINCMEVLDVVTEYESEWQGRGRYWRRERHWQADCADAFRGGRCGRDCRPESGRRERRR